jgi:transcriptional regulator with XRE-family HTH domain
VKEKRRLSGKKQKAITGRSRKTVSAIENAGTNFTFRTLIEALIAVDGDISELFRASTPEHYGNVHHELIHRQLQAILEKAPPEAVNGIAANIKTFWKAYVSPKS